MNKIIDAAAKIISGATVLFALIIDFLPNIMMRFYGKIVFYGVPAVILFANMIFQIKRANSADEKEKFKKQGLWSVFAVYAIAVLSLLFLQSSFRHGAFKSLSPAEIFSKWHFDMSANLVPFESIKLFFEHRDNMRGLFNVNIIGNLVVFMPMGFFAHFLFEKRIKNIGILALVMITGVSVIEFLQFVFFVGSADIDDVILNTLGALAVYIIFMIKPIKGAVNKVLE